MPLLQPHRRRYVLAFCRCQLLALTLFASAAPPLRAAIYNVGPGGPAAGCEAATVEAALALAAATAANDEIRIVNTQTFTVPGGLHVVDWESSIRGELILSGGWPDCATTTPSTMATSMRTTTSSPVLELRNSLSQRSIVELRRLRLYDSTATGLVVRGSVELRLQSVTVRLNSVHGVEIHDGASVYLDPTSAIRDNGFAGFDQGGGIYCGGATSRLVIDGLLASNASAFGGGLFAAEGCEVLLNPSARLLDNRANFGGAVELTLGAQLIETAGGALLENNRADQSGGAIYASGSGTSVDLAGVTLRHNSAAALGGGVLVDTQATVVLRADVGCQGRPLCPSVIIDNALDAGGFYGSAAAVLDGGELTLLQSRVAGNRLPDGLENGSVLAVGGTNSRLFAESLEIDGNLGARSAVDGSSGAQIRLAFTTVTGNLATPLSLTPSLGVWIVDAGTSAQILTSVFHPVAGFLAADGAEFSTVDCLITQSVAGLPPGSLVVVADPELVATAGGPPRPAPGSPAIDFCDTFFYTPTVGDLDGRARGHDHPLDPDGQPGAAGGRQDAGAHELWELFADGFASGDTSRWSASS